MGVATTWHINRTWLAKAPIMHLMWLSRVACCLTVWGLCCSTVCSLCYVCDTGMYSLSTLSLHTPVFCLSLAILSSFNTHKKQSPLTSTHIQIKDHNFIFILSFYYCGFDHFTLWLKGQSRELDCPLFAHQTHAHPRQSLQREITVIFVQSQELY